MFAMGIQHPSAVGFQSKPRLGQWEAVVSAAINAGVQVYKIRSEEERAEDALEFKEEQAAAAAAREAEALRIQQEAMKAMVDAGKPKEAAAAGAPGGDEKILGMKPTTFYLTAGLGAGALILGTMLLTKGG